MPQDVARIPDDNLRTWRALAEITDRTAFQLLCDEVLALHAQWGYDVRRVGVGLHGTKAGVPDSWGYDRSGRRCAFEYGSSEDWEHKLNADLESVKDWSREDHGFKPEIFVFCTNRTIPAGKVNEYRRSVPASYGWELEFITGGDLALALDTDCQDIRHRQLGIELRQHTWATLRSHCAAHLERFARGYQGKYQSELYVPRKAEALMQTWHDQARSAITAGNDAKQLAFIVGQAGAGKSNLVLHLARELGRRTAVILLSGSMLVSDDHALEGAVVDAAGYPASGHAYHANLDQMCELARHAGEVLVVVIDAVNEREDPRAFRATLKHLAASYQGRPVLILVTCRDVMWRHIQDPAWHGLTFVPEGAPSDQLYIPLDVYDDEEFHHAKRTYFERFQVRADLSAAATATLRSPLMLSLFSAVHEGRNVGLVPGVSEGRLWERYLAQRLDDASEAINRRLTASTLGSVVNSVAERMLASGTPKLTMSELGGIRHLKTDDASPTSALIRLEDAGILFRDGPDAIRFVHERCLEYVLARSLAGRLDSDATRGEALRQLTTLVALSRWRHMILTTLELTAIPADPIRAILDQNLWLASVAACRLAHRLPEELRRQIIGALMEQLSSKYTVDRTRAAELLGRLRADEGRESLLAEWQAHKSYQSLKALARLGEPAAADPFVLYLGRQIEWYWAEDERLVRELPQGFRELVRHRALTLLAEPRHNSSAAHALGYLRDESAVQPLYERLKTSGWGDATALLALLHIGSPAALERLRDALGKAGMSAGNCDREERIAAANGDTEREQRLRKRRDHLVHAIHHIRLQGFQSGVTPDTRRFLIELASHTDWYTRNMAVQCLGHLAIAESTETIVRSAALGYAMFSSPFEVFGSRIDAAPLIAILNDPGADVASRRQAVAALGYSQDHKALAPLLRMLRTGTELFATVLALGHLGYPEAIPALEQLIDNAEIDEDVLYHAIPLALGDIASREGASILTRLIRAKWPSPSHESVEAFVVIERESAIGLLSELWRTGDYERHFIVSALRWIGGEASVRAILELVGDDPTDAARMLSQTLRHGVGLGYFGGTRMAGPLDDRLVAVLDRGLHRLSLDELQKAIWALQSAATPKSISLLEGLIGDPRLDLEIGLPSARYTLRSAVVGALQNLGSARVLDETIAELSGNHSSAAVYFLSKMPRIVVVDALRVRLATLQRQALLQALQLLGWFGDEPVLDDVRRYIPDPRPKVANCAYEAEQRVLELIDIM